VEVLDGPRASRAAAVSATGGGRGEPTGAGTRHRAAARTRAAADGLRAGGHPRAAHGGRRGADPRRPVGGVRRGRQPARRAAPGVPRARVAGRRPAPRRRRRAHRRGPPLLRAHRRGRARGHPRRAGQLRRRPRPAGRLDDHPAGGQAPLHARRGARRRHQAARGDAGPRPRAPAEQGRDPHRLPQRRLLRGGRLRHRGGCADLLPGAGGRARRRPGGAAGRDHPRAGGADADPPPRGGRDPTRRRAAPHGRGRPHRRADPRPRAGRADRGPRPSAATRDPRAALRRLRGPHPAPGPSPGRHRGGAGQPDLRRGPAHPHHAAARAAGAGPHRAARATARRGRPRGRDRAGRARHRSRRGAAGNRSHEQLQYDLPTQARRQPGSTFKTFVLATAIAEGRHPETRLDGRQGRVDTGRGSWEVRNYDRRSYPSVTLAGATRLSVNSAFARLGIDVGVHRVAATATAMGVASHVPPDDAQITIGGGALGVTRWTWPPPSRPWATSAPITRPPRWPASRTARATPSGCRTPPRTRSWRPRPPT
jgi:hypothetical protein